MYYILSLLLSITLTAYILALPRNKDLGKVKEFLNRFWVLELHQDNEKF